MQKQLFHPVFKPTSGKSFGKCCASSQSLTDVPYPFATMAIEDILNAATTTIANFIQAINQDYKTRLPDLFPPGSPLANLWNTVIKWEKKKVKRGNVDEVDFSAEGVLDIFPFNFGKQVKSNPFTFKIKITIAGLPDPPPDSS